MDDSSGLLPGLIMAVALALVYLWLGVGDLGEPSLTTMSVVSVDVNPVHTVTTIKGVQNGAVDGQYIWAAYKMPDGSYYLADAAPVKAGDLDTFSYDVALLKSKAGGKVVFLTVGKPTNDAWAHAPRNPDRTVTIGRSLPHGAKETLGTHPQSLDIDSQAAA